MKFRPVLWTAGLLLSLSAPASALELLLEYPGILYPYSFNEYPSIDLEADGEHDLYTYDYVWGEEVTFKIVKLDGSSPWSYALRRGDLCPGCTGFNANIVAIEDFDPTPGREALFAWSADGTFGFLVVSVNTGQVAWTWPGTPTGNLAYFHTEDLNGDSMSEILVCYSPDGVYRSEVWGGGSSAGLAGQVAVGPTGGRAVPNPFVGDSVLTFDVARPDHLSAIVTDCSGRTVRHLFDGPVDSGTKRFIWDGRDDAGRDLPAGAYFGTCASGERTEKIKLVLVR